MATYRSAGLGRTRLFHSWGREPEGVWSGAGHVGLILAPTCPSWPHLGALLGHLGLSWGPSWLILGAAGRHQPCNDPCIGPQTGGAPMKRGPPRSAGVRRGPFSLKRQFFVVFGLRSGPDGSGQAVGFIWLLFRAKPSILDPFRTKFDVCLLYTSPSPRDRG